METVPADGIEVVMRVALVVHVFYPALWPELAACIRNVREPHDLFITYVNEETVREAKAEFPNARFVRCENRGYDVWPFLKVLQTLRLEDYGCVVKLHTKRDIDQDMEINRTWLGGAAWRNHLLSFIRSGAQWRRTLSRLRRPGVGMVADRHLVFGRDTTESRLRATYDRARREIESLSGRSLKTEGWYVAGTMFAARPEALRPLMLRHYSAEMFDVSSGHDRETFAHVMERMLGLSVHAAGLRIAACSGSVQLRRLYYSQTAAGKVMRFFFRKRVSGPSLRIWILGLPVFARTLHRS